MFNFLKKTSTLIAPISGETIDLSKVPDTVFSEKMAGDGVAINSTGDIVVAPCDGTISLLMNTGHAFAITTDNGLDILVHVGLETVSLNGEGFEILQSINAKVTAGTPILKIDRTFIESKGLSLITPVLITDPDKLKELNPIVNKQVSSGKDIIMEYKL